MFVAAMCLECLTYSAVLLLFKDLINYLKFTKHAEDERNSNINGKYHLFLWLSSLCPNKTEIGGHLNFDLQTKSCIWPVEFSSMGHTHSVYCHTEEAHI